MTSTNVQSFGVRADSIHVTRVISFTLVNIWETIYIFALYHVCHFKMGLSRVIALIIVNNKTYFVFFFCFLYKLDIWSVYFMTNITIYQPYRCETAGLFLLRHPPPPPKKKKKKNSAGSKLSQNSLPNCDATLPLFLLTSPRFCWIWVRQWWCTKELRWNDSFMKNYVSSCFNRPWKPELILPAQLDATKCV